MQQDESDANTFGAKVRRRREAQGLTLEQLAERSGLKPEYIAAIERDDEEPSLAIVLAIAKGLGVTPGELFASVQ